METEKKGKSIVIKCIIVALVVYIVLVLFSVFFINMDSEIFSRRGDLLHDVVLFNIKVAKYYFCFLPICSSIPSIVYLLFHACARINNKEYENK